MKFVPRTKRERYLVNKLWACLMELDQCIDQYIPACTFREENASDFIEHLRKTFPLIHKRYSKLMYERLAHALRIPAGSQPKEKK